MSIRASVLIALPLLLTGCLYAAAASGSEPQDISFDKPVQIPEAVLPPGKYTIRVEDHMADRAIVRITEPGGTEHYLLTVPSTRIGASAKGLIFYRAAAETEALHGWRCNGCGRALEFVYPKDEAVKLTAETGKPVLAYDPSYDKLPANLSPADRRVVTLWLLAPKTVTAEGKGEGLTAAKYSAPKMLAAGDPLPKKMPKTATSAFLELILGFLSCVTGLVVFLWRKLSALPKTWKMVGLTMVGGMVTGFALPIASAYQTDRIYTAPPLQILEVRTLNHDSEMTGLHTRIRRLKALVEVLQHKAK